MLEKAVGVFRRMSRWRGKLAPIGLGARTPCRVLAATDLSSSFLALCIVVLCGRGAAGDHPDTWIEVRSPHFVVASDVGEKRARRIAQQFEQLRGVFHSSFPAFRADPGQPIVIIAVKDEDAMKEWLPQYWQDKGLVHPSGLYSGQEDKHFVLLRMDAAEDNPYHTICHEYAHALLYLNFRSLPLWLNEGLSEFFGNCTIGDKEVRVGEADRDHLRRLKESGLLPVEELLRIDKSSTYYNEKDRASVFYAEAWALVHYLVLDPAAQKEEILQKFLAAWQESGDQTDAARSSLGDLRRFDAILHNYASQPSLSMNTVASVQETAAESYTERELAAAEVLVLRGDLLVHLDQADSGRRLILQALQLAPNLGAAHEALGFFHYTENNYTDARIEIEQAIRLGGASFMASYLRGKLLLDGSSFSEQTLHAAQKDLETAVRQNSEYAPAFYWLSLVYSHSQKTQSQAIAAAARATELDPRQIAYLVNLGHLLLDNHREEEAGVVANRVLKAAHTAQEQKMAQGLLDQIHRRPSGQGQSNP
jgi:tetratricopeptide (TPR) repeat protein